MTGMAEKVAMAKAKENILALADQDDDDNPPADDDEPPANDEEDPAPNKEKPHVWITTNFWEYVNILLTEL